MSERDLWEGEQNHAAPWLGTNQRARGENPRALGSNPRALGQNPRADRAESIRRRNDRELDALETAGCDVEPYRPECPACEGTGWQEGPQGPLGRPEERRRVACWQCDRHGRLTTLDAGLVARNHRSTVDDLAGEPRKPILSKTGRNGPKKKYRR